MAIMGLSGTDALAGRRTFDYLGDPFARRDYFVPSSAEDPGPHAYLVEQPAGVVIRPHFHAVDQFQVVVHGRGRLGRKPVEPVTVHYADAYTGYGPIEAGEEGIFYFSLRPGFDRGARYLPETRDEQLSVPGGRRHRLAPLLEAASPEELEDAPLTSRVLIEPEADGLSASEVIVPAGSPWEPAASLHGQFLVVISGQLLVDEEPFDRWSCLYAPAGERWTGVAAGDTGCQVLLLEYPEPRTPIAEPV